MFYMLFLSYEKINLKKTFNIFTLSLQILFDSKFFLNYTMAPRDWDPDLTNGVSALELREGLVFSPFNFKDRGGFKLVTFFVIFTSFSHFTRVMGSFMHCHHRSCDFRAS